MPRGGDKKFYVYDFAYEDGSHYVGKGCRRRIDHWQEFEEKHGVCVSKKILFRTDDEQEAFDEETRLYHHLAKRGKRLINARVPAGQGKVPSEEVIEIISRKTKEAMADPNVRKRVSEGVKKKWEDADFRQRVLTNSAFGSHYGEANSFYGRKHSEKTRKKIGDAFRGRPSPKRGISLNDDYKKRISDGTKKAMADPEVKKRLIENTRLAMKREDVVKNMSAANAAAWVRRKSNPAKVHQSQSIAASNGWMTRRKNEKEH